MKNVASYDVARSIDVFAWFNRIMHDAIREEKYIRELSAPFWIVRLRASVGCRRYLQHAQDMAWGMFTRGADNLAR